MPRPDKRVGLYAELSGRAQAHRDDMRRRMAAKRSAQRAASARIRQIAAPVPTWVPPPPESTETPAAAIVDRALVWARPVQPEDRDRLQRMLERAEAESRPLAAESIRERLAQLGDPCQP